ncbi:26S proteasome non-ATPase regulatory subunit 11-like [Schistocerca gregaria]|uniref:26S proteasome non-ATPase regulatory subunit 11-like n=1 Tax=Schistocerca gregaria TaxID=7010 RepID=UPI00211E5BC6|nr:26S proteasome non-ATPase regulatory subunit 11-like [Schistocerca gregaria]
MTSELASQLERAKQLAASFRPGEMVSLLRSIIYSQEEADSEAVCKTKEKAIYYLGKYFVQLGEAHELAGLLRSLRGFLSVIPRAKTAKIVRHLIDLESEIPNNVGLVIELCNEHIAWANEENRVFLRQRLEFKLSQSYYKIKEYQLALDIISKLIKEVKHLDDKPLLVETHLLESKIYHGLLNLTKARASLTFARTSANAIYCSPSLQANLDSLSGALHCEEKDYKTAYSYFFEAFENYDHCIKDRTSEPVNIRTSSNLSDFDLNNGKMSFQDKENMRLSTNCLKYMLLCKIMSNVKEDIHALINGKLALRYAAPELSAMRDVTTAYLNSSLKDFNLAINKHKAEIEEDCLLKRNLTNLYDTLLEQNLLRIIEPFSQVQLSYIASLIELQEPLLEKKLSQMILDKKLAGILNQGSNCLIIFDEPPPDTTFKSSLETISEMSKIVDILHNKALSLC